MTAPTYYCRTCAVGVGPLTQDEALAEIAAGHDLLSDPRPMPAADAIADAEQLRRVAFARCYLYRNSSAFQRRFLGASERGPAPGGSSRGRRRR